jgi:transposase
MEPMQRRCCGIDVHKKKLMVHVLPPQGQIETKPLEREFCTFTRDLRRLRDWLKECGVSEVVMEATGQYWRPVWNVLEEQIPGLMLVNPQHVKALAGRKTDRIDSRRLARYLERGELVGSFIPPRPIRELRDLTRGRIHLVEEVNRVKNRISTLCETGNIKVSSVATDLFGTSGRRMLHAVADGNRDADWMADYAQGRLRQKRQELAWALEGDFSECQRWMLGEALAHLKYVEKEIGDLAAEIGKRMQAYETQIQHLITIPGVDRIVAWTIIAELGTDMSVFPDAKHAASWVGICPGNHESAGKQMSGRTRKANPYLRRDLCQAAWAASHTKGTYLAALYRRFTVRHGHNKAIIAVAHQILIVAYHMLRNGEDYREQGGNYFDRQNRSTVASRLVGRLTSLGYQVNLQPASSSDATALPSPPVLSDDDAMPTLAQAPPPKPVKRRPGRPCKCASRGIPCTHKSHPLPRPKRRSDASIPGT